jgi:hypothetical protein
MARLAVRTITWSPAPPVSVSQSVRAGSRLVAALVERAPCARFAPSGCGRVGLELAGEHAQQRGLARAVGADDADAVAAQDAQREARRGPAGRRSACRRPRPRPPACPNRVRPRPRAGRADGPADPLASATGAGACSRRSRPWLRLRRAVTPRAASRSRGRSCGPACDVRFLLLQQLVAPGLEAAEADCSRRRSGRGRARAWRWSAGSRKRRSWLISTRPRQRASSLFQPFDGRQVEMVGRLVEQQDVGAPPSTRASAARRASPPDSVDGISETGQASFSASSSRSASWRRRRPPRHSRAPRRSRRGSGPAADSAIRAPGWTKRSPASGSIRPAQSFSRVDLPEPLRPTRPAGRPWRRRGPDPRTWAGRRR